MPYRDVTFWVKQGYFEVYTNPLSGWWYRLRRSSGNDVHPPASGWVLEAWHYGELLPEGRLTDHPWLCSAPLGELIAVTAVLAAEQTSPRTLYEGSDQEQERLRTRWQSWLKNAPDWATA